MKSFDWNGLHRGDRVFVHTSNSAVEAADAGTVRYVETVARRPNRVGIRLDQGDHAIVWPASTVVHRHAHEPTGACWRCDIVANAD
jgi:hypothetical protein